MPVVISVKSEINNN